MAADSIACLKDEVFHGSAGDDVKICLINAPTGTEFSDSFEFSDANIRVETCAPQLGILSLAAITEGLGCPTTIYDVNRAFFRYADEAGEKELQRFAEVAAHQIAGEDAAVFGFGSICSGYPLTIRIAEKVKALRPEA